MPAEPGRSERKIAPLVGVSPGKAQQRGARALAAGAHSGDRPKGKTGASRGAGSSTR